MGETHIVHVAEGEHPEPRNRIPRLKRRSPASGYGLTQEGKRLIDALAPLSDWARRWERRAMPK